MAPNMFAFSTQVRGLIHCMVWSISQLKKKILSITRRIRDQPGWMAQLVGELSSTLEGFKFNPQLG